MSDRGTHAEENARLAALKAQAARLRAEVAELEAANKQDELLKLAEVFQTFDLNGDGEISVDELKEGLQRMLRDPNITKEMAEKLMQEFDASGDGVLQLEEFQAVKVFQNKLLSFQRKGREEAAELMNKAREEKKIAEQEEAKAKLVESLVNERPATTSDRLVSMLPYIFPTLDALQYCGPLLPPDAPQTKFFITALSLYNQIPFGGLIAFFALSALANDLKLNRLVRYNMQQAILLDIGLILPGFFGGFVNVLAPDLDPSIVAAGSNLILIPFTVVILYSVLSSALGIEPNKVPFLSARVLARIPTSNMLKDMIEVDEDGNFVPKSRDTDRGDNDGEGGGGSSGPSPPTTA